MKLFFLLLRLTALFLPANRKLSWKKARICYKCCACPWTIWILLYLYCWFLTLRYDILLHTLSNWPNVSFAYNNEKRLHNGNDHHNRMRTRRSGTKTKTQECGRNARGRNHGAKEFEVTTSHYCNRFNPQRRAHSPPWSITITNGDEGGNSATTTSVHRTVMLGEDFQSITIWVKISNRLRSIKISNRLRLHFIFGQLNRLRLPHVWLRVGWSILRVSIPLLLKQLSVESLLAYTLFRWMWSKQMDAEWFNLGSNWCYMCAKKHQFTFLCFAC